jgi:translation initiation factor 6
LTVHAFDLMGSPNIGVYALTTNSLTILPVEIPSRQVKRVKDGLRGEIAVTSVGETRLVGVLAAANSNGIILPHFASDEEVGAIKRVWNGVTARIQSKRTALGNLILANDHGAIASENLMREKAALKKIKDVLDVEIVSGEIAGLPYVGSLATATNKGVLAHPMLKRSERRVLRDVLKVPVDVGTINGGIPQVSSGVLANEHGVLIGSPTTGPEIMIITNLLDS